MEHYKHPQHPLIRLDNEFDKERNCDLCESLISIHSSVYGCTARCEFYLHKYCAEMVPVIQQSDHDHPLFLQLGSRKICQGCKRYMYLASLYYACDVCEDYVLDIDCAFHACNPTIFQIEDHQLSLYYQPMADRSHCWVCNDILYLPVLKCVEYTCTYAIHLHCAPLAFPKTIQHKSHRWHTLVFREHFVEDDTGEYYCDTCEERRHPDHPVYLCDECPILYVAHLGCALSHEIWQILAKNYKSSVERSLGNTYTFHSQHLMICARAQIDDCRDCTLCKTHLKKNDPFYLCLSCEEVLHESCRKLAWEIKSLMHPQHLLTLLADGSTKGPSFQCRGCNQFCFSFIYQCQTQSCRFNLCIRCSRTSIPNVNYEDDGMHQLFLFDSFPFEGRCSHCDNVSTGFIFKCIEEGCRYNFHFHCAPFSFPQTITYKDQDQIHSDLRFATYSSFDTQCAICRRMLKTAYPSYKCDGCKFAVHAFCALSKTQYIPLLIAEYYSVPEKDRIVRINIEIERLRTNGDELKGQWMTVSNRRRALQVNYVEGKKALEHPIDNYENSEGRTIGLVKLQTFKEEVKVELKKLSKAIKALKLTEAQLWLEEDLSIDLTRLFETWPHD